jgi:hypothetical protein
MVQSNGAISLGSGPGPVNGGVTNRQLDLFWQIPAWRFYGAPSGTVSAGWRCNQGAIGEVRHVLGWIAQQIGRLAWHVRIDGVELPDEEAAAMMLKVANDQSTIDIATNLLVAGELNYIALSEELIEKYGGMPHFDTLVGPTLAGTAEARWFPVSVISNYRTELLNTANAEGLNLRALWSHPAKPNVADPPLRSVIDVLVEIEQLQDLAFSQNRSRIAQMGILTIAKELDFSVEGGDDFGTRLEDAINAPIADPRLSSASPILLRAPFEFMSGAYSKGSAGIQWTVAESPYDERLDEKMRFLIQRLAWGFPIPPEILLGMTATNRAVAFQIEETTYRSHIETIARLVGRIYAQALRMLMPDEQARVEVLPDPTDLLARRHSVADAKDLYDRGIVTAAYVRKVAGIGEEDAGTDEDLERIQILRKGNAPGESREADPSEVAGGEPVRASAGVQDSLRKELGGAISMAHKAAISRVGAAARTKLSRRSPTPELEIDHESVSNDRLPSLLGVDRVAELNLNVRSTVATTSKWLSEWWTARLLVDNAGISDEQAVESGRVLGEAFTEWAATTASSWPTARVPEFVLDLVLSSAFDESSVQPVD